jgi:hypothetical protein
MRDCLELFTFSPEGKPLHQYHGSYLSKQSFWFGVANQCYAARRVCGHRQTIQRLVDNTDADCIGLIRFTVKGTCCFSDQPIGSEVQMLLRFVGRQNIQNFGEI